MKLIEIVMSALPTKSAKVTVALTVSLAAGVWFYLPTWVLSWIPVNSEVTADLAKLSLALLILLLGAILTVAFLLFHYVPRSLNMQKKLQDANERREAARKELLNATKKDESIGSDSVD